MSRWFGTRQLLTKMFYKRQGKSSGRLLLNQKRGEEKHRGQTHKPTTKTTRREARHLTRRIICQRDPPLKQGLEGGGEQS